MRRPSAPAEAEDLALVLRVSPYGESDAVVKLLTLRRGVVAAMGKRARKRLVLEPFHTLRVALARGSGELMSLRTAEIVRPRATLLERAEAMEVAGLATRWTRALSPEHTPEPAVFEALERALDLLDRGEGEPSAVAASFGFTLLEALGFGLELRGCARCGRPRPAGRAALLSGRLGGIVCASCRGGSEAGFVEIGGGTLDAAVHDPWQAPSVVALRPVVTAAIEARCER